MTKEAVQDAIATLRNRNESVTHRAIVNITGGSRRDIAVRLKELGFGVPNYPGYYDDLQNLFKNEGKINMTSVNGSNPELWMMVTPEQADIWLAQSKSKQRNLSRDAVQKYADDMKNGQWLKTHEGLAFDSDSNILDGWHRLNACIQAGVAFPTIVTRGISNDVRSAMGICRVRKPGHRLQMNEEYGDFPSADLNAATMKWINLFENNTMSTGYGNRLNPNLLFPLVERHGREIQASFFIAHMTNKMISPSLAVALHYLMAKKDPMLATDFLQKLFKGNGLEQGDIIFRLRAALLENLTRRKNKMTHAYKAAIVILTWNALRVGRTQSGRAPTWKNEGENPDPFPTIR